MKNEQNLPLKQKRPGLYGTPFQASIWAVEIHQLPLNRFRWIAKSHNIQMTALHPVDSNIPFKTAKEAEDDFISLMKAQCICVCSIENFSITDIVKQL